MAAGDNNAAWKVSSQIHTPQRLGQKLRARIFPFCREPHIAAEFRSYLCNADVAPSPSRTRGARPSVDAGDSASPAVDRERIMGTSVRSPRSLPPSFEEQKTKKPTCYHRPFPPPPSSTPRSSVSAAGWPMTFLFFPPLPPPNK